MSIAQSFVQDRVLIDQTLRAATQMSGAQEEMKLSPAADADSKLLESEFGTQRLRPLVAEPPEMLLSLDVGGFFTTNAALTPGLEISDWVGRTVLRAAWFPQITENLSFLTAASYGLWRYADTSALDFDDFGAQSGLVWKTDSPLLTGGIPAFSAWAQYRYNRIFSALAWSDRLYETHFIEAGMKKAWALSPSVTAWGAGNAALSVEGQPALFRRHEYSVQAGALWQITPRLSSTLLYRAALFDYVTDARCDVNHLLFLGLSCQLTSNVRADLFVSGVGNDSDNSIFDYEVINAGLNFAITKIW